MCAVLGNKSYDAALLLAYAEPAMQCQQMNKEQIDRTVVGTNVPHKRYDAVLEPDPQPSDATL
jgi:hypothetical protein